MREIRSRIYKLMRWASVASSIAIPGLLNHSAAQVVTGTLVQVTGPALASPGEHISFCFQSIKYNYTPQNPPQSPVDVGHSLVVGGPVIATLRILDGVTGSVKASKDVSFPVAGSPALPSDPCVEFAVPVTSVSSAAAIATPPSIYIGVVSVSSQPLPPGAAPNSSFDIFTPIFGIPTNIRHIVPGPTCPPGEYPCVY